jgi:hypothetical protein
MGSQSRAVIYSRRAHSPVISMAIIAVDRRPSHPSCSCAARSIALAHCPRTQMRLSSMRKYDSSWLTAVSSAFIVVMVRCCPAVFFDSGAIELSVLRCRSISYSELSANMQTKRAVDADTPGRNAQRFSSIFRTVQIGTVARSVLSLDRGVVDIDHLAAETIGVAGATDQPS